MKQILIAVGCLSLFGCASQPRSKTAAHLTEHEYAPEAASALVFDSPIRPSYELQGLDRAAHEAGAFIGYQDSTVEYFAVGVIDHQSSDPNDATYDRWTMSEKSGVRYR